MPPKTYNSVLEKFARNRRIGEEVSQKYTHLTSRASLNDQGIISRIDASGDGVPVLFFKRPGSTEEERLLDNSTKRASTIAWRTSSTGNFMIEKLPSNEAPKILTKKEAQKRKQEEANETDLQHTDGTGAPLRKHTR
eukprot:gene17366-5403_t